MIWKLEQGTQVGRCVPHILPRIDMALVVHVVRGFARNRLWHFFLGALLSWLIPYHMIVDSTKHGLLIIESYGLTWFHSVNTFQVQPNYHQTLLSLLLIQFEWLSLRVWENKIDLFLSSEQKKHICNNYWSCKGVTAKGLLFLSFLDSFWQDFCSLVNTPGGVLRKSTEKADKCPR